jgi:hypothetical protein
MGAVGNREARGRTGLGKGDVLDPLDPLDLQDPLDLGKGAGGCRMGARPIYLLRSALASGQQDVNVRLLGWSEGDLGQGGGGQSSGIGRGG